MYTDPQVERVLSRGLGNVFVGANTSSFQSLTRKLFIFIRDEVAAEGKFVNVCTFTTEIENPVWDQGHHGCTGIWGTVCSCNNGSSERDDDPCFLLIKQQSQNRRTSKIRSPIYPESSQ
ncbi:hypothetical protein HHX47_DHR6000561 [Lentinula edodes]|nr:hypothetical protein HHX47_DHR6000561 [Lentinula edodes]